MSLVTSYRNNLRDSARSSTHVPLFVGRSRPEEATLTL